MILIALLNMYRENVKYLEELPFQCFILGHAKGHHKMVTVQPDCLKVLVVCGTVYGGHALKRSSGVNRKSIVSYYCPGFLSSATWPSMEKKHINGLINQSIIKKHPTEHLAGILVCFTMTVYRVKSIKNISPFG